MQLIILIAHLTCYLHISLTGIIAATTRS